MGLDLAALLTALPTDKAAAVAARAKWLEQARPKQIPPPGDWFVFLAMAGRGFGKSLLGAQEAWWTAAWNDGARVAVVAPTAGDLRRICFESESGILRAVPAECLEGGNPTTAYNRSLFELRFANGSVIQGYSAAEPDRLRGPNHSWVWCDEIAAWDRAVEAWNMLTMTLRIGSKPQVVATTTPRPVPLVRDLVARAGRDVHLVRGSTRENAANLAPAFLEQLEARFAGTRIGRQELEAEILTDLAGALWSRAMIEASRIAEAPASLQRIVVAVDPSGASDEEDENADEIGIVVAGIDREGVGYILEDGSLKASPEAWGVQTVALFDKWSADRVVVERNYGGAMAEAVIRASRKGVPVTMVTASRGKIVRAEPIAALFEKGRVRLVGSFPRLEDQLAGFTRSGFKGSGSPDRADAAVWGLSDLMLSDTPVFDTSYSWVG
ncbi:terminase large subunit domain-containing protein [Dankookia rubra]|uniref:terminase large subunit domain-containing protein n=1 Tax=Dankookia rubra TaxID=1442381 RepID=UPI0019D5C3DD|nr:terminase family protein [Dankookia rubra]